MIREKIVLGKDSEYPLNGMLTFPDHGTSPLPAVVMVHGSGPSDMDEHIMKLYPFKDLAEGLAQYGIASLRYDKRTFAHKFRTAKIKNITVEEETIEDALKAVSLLKERKEIDPDRIYIIGHSMGAMLAPRIDAEGGDVRGFVLMAGTPYRLEDIVLRQLKQAGETGNGPMKWIVDAEYRIYEKRFKGLYEMPDDEAKKKKFAGGINLYYFKEMGQKTASDYLLESDKPVLIMQGGKDFQVLADVDLKGFQEILKDRGNTVYRLYPDLNHLFVKGITGNILKATKEYSVEQKIPNEVISDIASFILK